MALLGGGGAKKLFPGEVAAGNEAKSQPWPRARKKAMTVRKETGGSGAGGWLPASGGPDGRVR